MSEKSAIKTKGNVKGVTHTTHMKHFRYETVYEEECTSGSSQQQCTTVNEQVTPITPNYRLSLITIITNIIIINSSQ